VGHKILVVDDEDKIRNFLKIRLERTGYEVATAANGREGIESVIKRKPDLIITDVMMPDVDGYKMYKALKSEPSTAGIPIIILSERSEMGNTFVAMGATCFLPKPFDIDEMLMKVSLLLIGIGDVDINELNEKLKEIQQNEGEENNGKGRIIVASEKNEIFEACVDKLQAKGCEVLKAVKAEDLIIKACSFNPDLIVCEVELGEVSSYDIIKILKKISNLKSKIIVFSFFQKLEHARNSSLDYFYTHYLKQDFADDKNPPYYLGAFSKDTIKETFEVAISRFVKDE